MEELKLRDVSIDIIKFFAVLFIINSHADMCYPKYSMLATGGAIGDTIFLFCSGYTLFLGRMKRFDNWYKRRISRIYPSVFVCVLVDSIITGKNYFGLSIERLAGGEFVIAIMIYYVLLFCVQKWFINQIPWIFLLTAVVTLVLYWFFPYKYEVSVRGIYGVLTYFRWFPYFGVMLMGAWLGLKTKTGEMKVVATKKDFLLMLVCFLVFYGIQFLAKKNAFIAPWQIVTVPFLYGIVYFFWRCCNASMFKRIYDSHYGKWFVMFVGEVCLESYLIQYSILTGKLNFMFPLNIPILIIVILAVSYLCRCMARILSQTFRTEDYEWKKVFAVF